MDMADDNEISYCFQNNFIVKKPGFSDFNE